MVTVTDLAVAMGLSVRRVQAICRAHYGQSPTGLLRGIRLDNARTRLLAGELAAGRAIVAAVAAAAGFSRPARFTAPTGTGSVRLPPRPSNAPAPDRP
jgi:AraC-like DNA-binding protein